MRISVLTTAASVAASYFPLFATLALADTQTRLQVYFRFTFDHRRVIWFRRVNAALHVARARVDWNCESCRFMTIDLRIISLNRNSVMKKFKM